MCAPCKIILDSGRVLPASLHYYAEIAEGFNEVVQRSIELSSLSPEKQKQFHVRVLTEEQIEEAHARSEVMCQRAKLVREWAEEDRLWITQAIGGEYAGSFDVSVDGVSKKGS